MQVSLHSVSAEEQGIERERPEKERHEMRSVLIVRNKATAQKKTVTMAVVKKRFFLLIRMPSPNMVTMRLIAQNVCP